MKVIIWLLAIRHSKTRESSMSILIWKFFKSNLNLSCCNEIIFSTEFCFFFESSDHLPKMFTIHYEFLARCHPRCLSKNEYNLMQFSVRKYFEKFFCTYAKISIDLLWRLIFKITKSQCKEKSQTPKSRWAWK